VGTGDGLLQLLEVQPEGKAPMRAMNWRNGAQPRPGEHLGGGPDDPTDAGAMT
jgi:methionyl-tRNA formyltransferase